MIVKKMSEVFQSKGIEVNLFRMEQSRPEDLDLGHTIGIAFPVACQSTYPLVWNFIRSFPTSTGTEVFMVDTLQAFSGAIVGPLKRALKKKGYVAIGAKEIIMPNSYYPKKISKDKNARKVSKGLGKAQNFANAIVDGNSRWLRVPMLSDAFYWLVSRPKTWEVIADTGKKFEIDRDECNGCGICEKLCPVGNISINDFPRFGGGCQSCMRCISFCPEAAIFLPDKEDYQTYTAVKAKELILK